MKWAAKLQRRVEFDGVAEAARHMGVSREHLSRVLHGKRRANAAIRRGLARMGITCTVDGKAFEEAK